MSSDRLTKQSIIWPRPGVTTFTQEEWSPESIDKGESLVQLAYTATNTGTERARFLGQPNAKVGFPHIPGYGGAGRLKSPSALGPAGAAVAARCASHQQLLVVDDKQLRLLPEGTSLKDATLWQLAVTAMHGLGQLQADSAEPTPPAEDLTIIGAGIIGALTRRIAMARGNVSCRVIAETAAKQWTVASEAGVQFVTANAFHTSELNRSSHVLDVTGTANGLRTATDAVADGGRIVLLGSPRTLLGAVPIKEIQARGITIIGAHIDSLPDHSREVGEDLDALYSDEFFSLLLARRLTFEDLFTEFRPGDAPYAYRRMVTDRTIVAIAFNWQEHQLDQADAVPKANGQAVYAKARTVRFGIVGCGDIGSENAHTLSTVPGAEVVACFDASETLAEGLAAELGATTCEDLDSLLGRRDIDAVIVATPHHTHEPISLAVLRSGKHLLLEKPLAADLAGAQRITAASERAQVIASVLFPTRYEAGYVRARQALDEGLLGIPTGALSAYLVDKPPSYYLSGYSNRSVSSWRTSKAMSGGGVLIMNVLHHVDAIRSLFQLDATSVYAQTAPSANAPEIEDVASMVVRFGNAIATFVAGASVVGGAGESLKIWGDIGQATVLPSGAISSLRAETNSPDFGADDFPDARWTAINRFCDAVRKGSDPDVTMADALAAQLIISAAYESAETGEPVALVRLQEGRMS